MVDRPSPFALGIIVEVLLLVGAFISGIVTAGAVGVTQARWNGNCIFSSDVSCEPGATSRHKYVFTPKNSGLCHFSVHLQTAVIVTSFVFAIYRIMVLVYRRCNIEILRLVTTGIFAVYTILVMAVAAIITAGLNSFCGKLVGACPEHSDKSCPDFQGFIKWDGSDIDGSSFYSTMQIAKAAAWISDLFWLSLSICSFVLFLRARRGNRQPPITSAGSTGVPSDVNKPL